MDLLLTDLDGQLHARLPTYQHALTSGKPFASILAGLRKLNDTLGPSSRKAPIVTSTGDSEDSALGKLDRMPAGLPDMSCDPWGTSPRVGAILKSGLALGEHRPSLSASSLPDLVSSIGSNFA